MEFFFRILEILLVVTTLYFISQIFSAARSRIYAVAQPFGRVDYRAGRAQLFHDRLFESRQRHPLRTDAGHARKRLALADQRPDHDCLQFSLGFRAGDLSSFLYLFFGWLFFDVHYQGSFLLALLFLLLTTLVLACIGILSASFAMVFKRGDPFGILLGTGSALFSGVFFPTQMLGGRHSATFRASLPADLRSGRHSSRPDSRTGTSAGARAINHALPFSARPASLLALGL